MSKNRCKIVLSIPGTSFHSLATIMFRIVKSVHHFVFIQEGKIIGSGIQRGGHNNIVKLPRIMKRHIWNPTPSRNTFLFGVNMDVIQINSTIIGIKIGMKHHFGSCFNEIQWKMFPVPKKNIKNDHYVINKIVSTYIFSKSVYHSVTFIREPSLCNLESSATKSSLDVPSISSRRSFREQGFAPSFLVPQI